MAQRNTVERKISFYRIYTGNNSNGKPYNFNVKPILSQLNELPLDNFHDVKGLYETDEEGDSICAFPQLDIEDYPSLRFCRIRRSSFPLIENAGNIRDLVINPEEGLLEPIHVVFFPHNIVGVEYNHFGPRISRLGDYLLSKTTIDYPTVRFEALIRDDVIQQLID